MRHAQNVKTDRRRKPELTVAQILAWADAHRRRTGQWPTKESGPVADGPLGTSWRQADNALRLGLRGLPGCSSLAQLLAAERGVRNPADPPRLTEALILEWADAHRSQADEWPDENSGPVAAAAGESWQAINQALRDGLRGLPGGDSLARLLARRRQARNRISLPPLTVQGILALADAHRRRTGQWPKRDAGPVVGVRGETWLAFDRALTQGCRALPGGSSLSQLLAERRGVRNRGALPSLTEGQILAWAEAHRRRTGKLPTAGSGAIPEAAGESWKRVDNALREGRRGLKGKTSLPALLDRLR